MLNISTLYHFLAGFVIGTFLGIMTASACGLTKEYADQVNYGGWDWYDLLATFIGGICGALLHRVISGTFIFELI